MPYIPLSEKLPGITGLLDYRKDTALPIRELTQILLRGESTLTEGERELIAAVVSQENECQFCTAAHSAIANILLDENIAENVRADIDTAPVSKKMKALLKVAKAAVRSGRMVTEEMVADARAEGATDRELHDTVLIAALFCLYNHYVDGLASVTPTDPGFYDRLGKILKDKGYLPSANRYADL